MLRTLFVALTLIVVGDRAKVRDLETPDLAHLRPYLKRMLLPSEPA